MSAKQHPVLFTDDMIRAIEADRKSQTRRLNEPKWERGDILYGRHAWRWNEEDGYLFRVDHASDAHKHAWKPSIHMPRVIARVWLEVVSVRPEPLQAISAEDAIAEGLEEKHCAWGIEGVGFWFDPRVAYFKVWDAIYPSHQSKSDPTVWLTTFKRVPRPDDVG